MTQEQWQAIRSRDKTWDGRFYYGMKTTKTVCKPSCRKRTGNPKNIVIFSALEDALAAGYHPCKLCRPELSDWSGSKNELVAAAKKQIEEHYTEKFSLEVLADRLFINKHYLLRTFKELTGETLLGYHNLVRCQAAEELLTRPELSISYIGSAVGYSSASHFAHVYKKTRGRTPSDYREAHFQSFER